MNIFFRTCACAFTPSIEMRSSIKFMSNFMIMISTNRFPISTPLARACSLCPIHNSLYIPHTALLRTAPPLFWRGGTGVRIPLAQACSSCPIQNSEFKIHNSLFCRCKDNFFLLYYQDIVPLHLEVTEKIGTIK